MAFDKDIHAILLAAGQSTRMGQKNKLLLKINGIPLVRRSAINILNSNVVSLTVVTGFDEEKSPYVFAKFVVQFGLNRCN